MERGYRVGMLHCVQRVVWMTSCVDDVIFRIFVREYSCLFASILKIPFWILFRLFLSIRGVLSKRFSRASQFTSLDWRDTRLPHLRRYAGGMNLPSTEQTQSRETSFISDLDPYPESQLQFWPPEWEFPCMSSLEYTNNEQNSMPKGDAPTHRNTHSEQKNNIPCLGIHPEGHYTTDVQGIQQDMTYGRAQIGAPLHIPDMYLQHPSMCPGIIMSGVPCDAMPGGQSFMANSRLAWPRPHLQRGKTSGASTKPRLRWTPELHEMFVNAVKQLGGAKDAKPRGDHPYEMILQRRCHLQKYRLTHALPDSEMQTQQPTESPNAVHTPVDDGGQTSVVVPSEGDVPSEIDEEASVNAGSKKRQTRGISDSLDVEMLEYTKGRRQKLEEALILQLRAQKQLQEQLERQLQRCIDANARYISSLVKQEGLDEKYPELMTTFAESNDLWESQTQNQKREIIPTEGRHPKGEACQQGQTSSDLN